MQAIDRGRKCPPARSAKGVAALLAASFTLGMAGAGKAASAALVGKCTTGGAPPAMAVADGELGPGRDRGAAATRAARRDRGGGHRAEREAMAELERRMRDPEPAKRRVGVKSLCALGSDDALALVLRALADPEPEVADEAQWRLPEFTERRQVERMLGREGLRSSEPWVRLRVAEALGRVAVPLDGRLLLREVKRGEVKVARALLWSLERLAARGLLAGDRARIARELRGLIAGRGDSEVRAAALAALLAAEGEAAAQDVRAALDGREAALRVAALERIELLGEDEALGRVREQAAAQERAVRLAALAALERLGTREAVSVLAERLAHEPRPRLARRALAALRSLSGLRYRLDPRPWRDWAASLPEDWRPGARTKPEPLRGGTVALAGLPIVSDRVAFLIDFSGSLWNVRPDGSTRKEKVDEALGELLAKLPEETLFTIVPYTDEPHPFKERLVPATGRNVRAADAWFRDCREHGKGNVYDAIALALADERVDTICVLTDGAPTGGHRWKLDLMVPLLVQDVRFRGVAIDSIIVDAPPRLRRHWEALAEQTGGRSLAISMDPPPAASPDKGNAGAGKRERSGR